MLPHVICTQPMWEQARCDAEPAPPATRSDVGDQSAHWSVAGFGLRPMSAAVALIVADWCAVFACLAAVWWLRDGPLPRLIPSLGPVDPFFRTLALLYWLVPWTLAFAAARLYTRRALFWDETRRVLHACTWAALFAIAASFVEKQAAERSRLMIAGVWLATIVVVPVVRLQMKRLLGSLGLWRKRVLIVGAGDAGMQVMERIRQNPELGYLPVAFVDDDAEKIGGEREGLPVHGLSALSQAIVNFQVEDVVVAMPELPREQLFHLVALCEGRVQSIRLVPDLFGLASVGVEAEDLGGVLLLHMRWNLAKPWNVFVKRVFDLAIAIAVAAALAPVLVATAIAIRLDSPGPIFFVHDRLGYGRRRFGCFKFRTMYVDNEERLRRHLAADQDARAEWSSFAKLRALDPRVTSVGRFLRRSSLDELPQLINVMRREMSLVGPRPYLPIEIERMGDVAETVLKAPPGITGLWQVSGRNNLTFEQRVRLDEYYVRNWSLWMDVVVLLKTAGAVLRGDGAY